MSNNKEQRLTVILEGYWNKIRGDRDFPDESDFKPEDVKHIWNNCFLIDVKDGYDGKGFKYTFLGQELIDAYGDDISQEEVHVLVEPTKQRIVEKVKETIEARAPIHDESEFINANSITVRYRKIFLPLGRHGEVRYVVGGMRWKGY